MPELSPEDEAWAAAAERQQELARKQVKAEQGKSAKQGCIVGAVALALIAIMWVVMSAQNDTGGQAAAPTESGSAQVLELGREYAITEANLAVMDGPKSYADEWEFRRHLVLILDPGDVVVPQETAGLFWMKIRVATHEGRTRDAIGYVPSDLLMKKCRPR